MFQLVSQTAAKECNIYSMSRFRSQKTLVQFTITFRLRPENTIVLCSMPKVCHLCFQLYQVAFTFQPIALRANSAPEGKLEYTSKRVHITPYIEDSVVFDTLGHAVLHCSHKSFLPFVFSFAVVLTYCFTLPCLL